MKIILFFVLSLFLNIPILYAVDYIITVKDEDVYLVEKIILNKSTDSISATSTQVSPNLSVREYLNHVIDNFVAGLRQQEKVENEISVIKDYNNLSAEEIALLQKYKLMTPDQKRNIIIGIRSLKP